MKSGEIKSQYEAWIYPERIFDLDHHLASSFAYHDVRELEPLFCKLASDLRPNSVLIAGCGTNQAATHAFKNPQIEYTAIDISHPSLEHQRFLKKKYGLKNLTLVELNIEDVWTLNKSFDHIISTGVLHHFQKPDQALKAIANVLKPGGVLNLMLYATSKRVGVYQLQEAFSVMGLSQIQADVDLIRSFLDQNLVKTHAAYDYVQLAMADLSYDGAIVDTFLNPIDHSYTVLELHELLDSCDLTFDQWITPWLYEPTYFFGSNQPLLKRIKKLNSPKKHHVTDLLTGFMGTHRFLARPSGEYTNRQKYLQEESQLGDQSHTLHPLCKLVKRLHEPKIDIMHNDTVLGVLPEAIGNCLISYLEKKKLPPSDHLVDKDLAPYLDQLLDIKVIS